MVVIVGATASGKSDAAVMVARRFGGEVVNADSRLFYRGMEIGTASPLSGTLKSVPHHLVGFLKPEDPYNLARFLSDARSVLNEIHDRSALPVVAGGTGQYVWGLLEGWQVPEIPPDTELRVELEQQLEQQGVASLFERLQELDPAVAENTDRLNPRRVIRALERVKAGTSEDGKPAGRKSVDPGYNSIIIGLYVERAELHRRIAERVDKMLSAGWVVEVERLMEQGVDFTLPALSAIGYPEIAAYIREDMTLDEARERTIRATNRLVRHQNNWFKQTDTRIKWVDVTDGQLDRVFEPLDAWPGQ